MAAPLRNQCTILSVDRTSLFSMHACVAGVMQALMQYMAVAASAPLP